MHVKEIKKLVEGSMAWAMMFPLLLLNYMFWERFDFLAAVGVEHFMVFWSFTVFILYAANELVKPSYASSALAGSLRWLFVAVAILLRGGEPSLIATPLFVSELPIMVVSYMLARVLIVGAVHNFT